MTRRTLLIIWGLLLAACTTRAADVRKPPDYGQVHAVFAKNCLACHDAKEAEGELVLESHASLMKGGETGAAVVPGKSGESLLVKLIEHSEKPFMPPPKKGAKLSDAEIATIRAWIDAGAKPGDAAPQTSATPVVALPKVKPRVTTKRPAVNALALSVPAKLFAAGLPGVVELRSLDTRSLERALHGHAGNVNDVAFSADGKLLAAAAGDPGVAGEVKIWDVARSKLARTIKGHADAIYCVAISPDGKTLATGSYDQEIKLWDVMSGNELRTLKGHNGCVFDVAFRPDGKVLASASADRTVKLWDVASGARLDTFSESLKELQAVVFSSDGTRIYAAGVDNRIRAWAVSPDAKEGTNKLLQSVFAHEGAILRLAFSPDGKTLASSADNGTLKIWNPADLTIRHALPQQPDWPTALALTDAMLLVGRLDGTIAAYDTSTAALLPPPKPELTSAWPKAVQRGGTTRLKLSGKNLSSVTDVKSADAAVQVRLEPRADDDDDAAAANSVRVTVITPKEMSKPEFLLTLTGGAGDSNALNVSVDSLSQSIEAEPNDDLPKAQPIAELPAAVWGVLGAAGDADVYGFDAKANQPLVIDVGAARIGGKCDAVLTLMDSAGHVLMTNNDAEGSPDPLLTFTPPSDGHYVVKVSELQIGTSPDHFYRLSIGNFPVVTGVFPLGIPANSERRVRLLGFNLPADATVMIKSGAAEAEAPVPIDPLVFRTRTEPKVLIDTLPASPEVEPNDLPASATRLATPGMGDGLLSAAGDVDLYRFDARKGETWIVETLAARRGSPADTKIEILDAAGRSVPRVLLRAVRDSYIEFRPIGPNDIGGRLKNWEEMELNEYLYLSGEVVKLFLYPRGPDSQWDFFALDGKRRCYFDTTAATHAMDETCYIVEPLPPGSTPPPNGLPTFPINFANDDDAERKLGADSRLTFVAPSDGAFLIRVTDPRNFGGERFAYRVVVRHAKPDFNVTLTPESTSVPPGSGVAFTVKADRADGFDGPIRIECSDLPPGFSTSGPIVIEAGQVEARGTLLAAADAARTFDGNARAAKITAAATIDGKSVTKSVNGFGKLSIADKPKLLVALDASADAKQTSELTIAPGRMISAWLSCDRAGGHAGLVSFDVQNLPHGVIVADIGLNGVLIPEKENRREIFLVCAPWVGDQDRMIFARAREAGSPTSRPLMLHVRRPQK